MAITKVEAKKILEKAILQLLHQEISNFEFSEHIPPNVVESVLNDLGYERDEIETNSWEHDFWIDYEKDDEPCLVFSGCWWNSRQDLSLKEDEC